MMATPIFEEKLKRTNQMPFCLPKDVTFENLRLPEEKQAYVFNHETLGELGRLLIIPRSSNQTELTWELFGDPEDPMTAKRQEVFDLITQTLSERMDALCGKNIENPNPNTSEVQKHLIKSIMMPCNTCGEPTALMIDAPNANTQGELENYARLMFSKIQDFKVPTWIVGAEKEIFINGKGLGEALILKFYPFREKAKIMLSTELNAIFDDLMETHCRKPINLPMKNQKS